MKFICSLFEEERSDSHSGKSHNFLLCIINNVGFSRSKCPMESLAPSHGLEGDLMKKKNKQMLENVENDANETQKYDQQSFVSGKILMLIILIIFCCLLSCTIRLRGVDF